MSLVNYSTREITSKIVYYGPGRSGKTTNLQYIYGQVPEDRRGRMVSLATETDRTLFFDFRPRAGLLRRHPQAGAAGGGRGGVRGLQPARPGRRERGQLPQPAGEPAGAG